MAAVLRFTPNLYRHLDCPDTPVDGATVRAALEQCLLSNPRLRGYLLDEQGAALRTHVAIFVNERLLQDRNGLSDPLADGDEVFVVQALSGG